MDTASRWDELVALDEELMKSGYILSEWVTHLTREADVAYANGANLAAILTAMAVIETYLRSEYPAGERPTLARLITGSPLCEDLKTELHALREYRNSWVHVDEPWENEPELDVPGGVEDECAAMAKRSVRALREVLYENPWI